jgi:hypothetical protein
MLEDPLAREHLVRAEALLNSYEPKLYTAESVHPG